MKRVLLIFLVCVVTLCTGCNVPSKGVKVYFFKDGKIAPVNRVIPTIESPLMIAITELMKGPNITEIMEGYSTEIPIGTQAKRIERQSNVAIIDFNDKLEGYTGGGVKVRGLVAQIVYTATSIKGVKYTLLKLQGADSFTLGSDDYVIDHPLERGDIKL